MLGAFEIRGEYFTDLGSVICSSKNLKSQHPTFHTLELVYHKLLCKHPQVFHARLVDSRLYNSSSKPLEIRSDFSEANEIGIFNFFCFTKITSYSPDMLALHIELGHLWVLV